MDEGESREHRSGQELDDGGILGEERASSHDAPVGGPVPAPVPAPATPDDPEPAVDLASAGHLIPGEDGRPADGHEPVPVGRASAGEHGALPMGGPTEQGEPGPDHEVPGLLRPESGARRRE